MPREGVKHFGVSEVGPSALYRGHHQECPPMLAGEPREKVVALGRREIVEAFNRRHDIIADKALCPLITYKIFGIRQARCSRDGNRADVNTCNPRGAPKDGCRHVPLAATK